MIETAIVVTRLLQYLGAAVLFGSSLFFVYALPLTGPGSAAESRWARPLLAGAAALLTFSSLVGLGAQASVLAGSWTEGLTIESIGAVVSYFALGKAAVVRASAATLALVLVLAVRPGRMNWLLAAAFGAIATASLAWMGHAAATEGEGGAYLLASDVIHALTAAVWVGALVAFAFLLAREPNLAVLHTALRRFSRVGLPLVVVLALTGLANGWFLVGPANVTTLPVTPYGGLLLLKLTFFATMLVLAGINRNRLTPAIRADMASGIHDPLHVAQLRRSIVTEAALAVAVLAAVAWFGTMSPPSAA